MKGFFAKTSLKQVRRPPSLFPRCGACGLFRQCDSPKMPVAGKGRKRILVLGEAPGRNEDREGIPFIGKAGQYLQSTFDRCGVDFFEECWIYNSIICYPGRRHPTDKEIHYCRPNVLNTINHLNPDVVLLLGGRAVKSLFGHVWKEECGDIGRWVGWRIPCQRPNAWLCPTWDPSYCLQENNRTLDMIFEQHLQDAVNLEGKPWQEVPDYRKEVTIIKDDEQASDAIRDFWSRWNEGKIKSIAWDIEANMIKPDHPDAAILSCSISDGEFTISYPWYGEAIKATLALLQSNVPKITQNGKYESRWMRAKYGISIKNDAFDTILACHVLDNRKEICGLKFQSFVRLGVGDYDSHLESYRRGKEQGGYSKNRLKETPLDDLLLYGGIDSLVTWKIAHIQAKELGIQI